MRVLIFVVAFLLIMVSNPFAQEAKPVPDTWAKYEQAFLGEQQRLELKERQALQAINQSEKAYQYALRIEDHQAVPVAERAMEKARQALESIREKQRRVSERIVAVNKARKSGSAGKVAVASTLKGTVQVKTAQGWVALTPGALLKPGQQIRTGDASKAEVLFSDGTQVNLHANTEFLLESDDGELSSYRLSIGRVKAFFKKYAQRRFRVRTPNAAAGVRGTEFVMETSDENGTALVVLEGEVEFRSADGSKRVTVRQGELAIQTADNKMRGPEPFDVKALQPWWND